MSIFDDAVNDAMEVWFDADLMASLCTYNGVSIPAHFSREEAEVVNASGRGERAALEVRASDVVTPAYRDTVVVGADTWHVMRVLSSDGYSHRLELYRGEKPVW
jgi:hypothetical protein